MNILLLGAGENGLYLADYLAKSEHNVCVLEANPAVAAEAREKLDARIVEGNGSSVSLLEEAGVAECDLFMGLSSTDDTNVVSASLAKALGAKVAVARVHASVQQEQWLFDYRTRFDLDYIFSIEHLAAVELAKFLRNPDALMVEEMAGGKIELQQLEVEVGSRADGGQLRTIGLPPRIRVGCLQRGTAVVVPQAEDPLQAGDIVTLFGNPRHLQPSVGIFRRHKPQDDAIRRVVIFGGGETGLALARMLENGPFRTRILEKDPRRCQLLAHSLKNTQLIQADATSTRILREEQVGEADFFVATTNDDEDNIMTSLQARDLGVGRCICTIHRADYAEFVTRSSERLGIHGAVSPRLATLRNLSRFFTQERLHTLVHLPGGVEIVEFVIGKNSPLDGHQVAAIPWPPSTGLVCTSRGSSILVPAAGDELRHGDSVIALVAPESRRAFTKLVG